MYLQPRTALAASQKVQLPAHEVNLKYHTIMASGTSSHHPLKVIGPKYYTDHGFWDPRPSYLGSQILQGMLVHADMRMETVSGGKKAPGYLISLSNLYVEPGWLEVLCGFPPVKHYAHEVEEKIPGPAHSLTEEPYIGPAMGEEPYVRRCCAEEGTMTDDRIVGHNRRYTSAGHLRANSTGCDTHQRRRAKARAQHDKSAKMQTCLKLAGKCKRVELISILVYTMIVCLYLRSKKITLHDLGAANLGVTESTFNLAHPRLVFFDLQSWYLSGRGAVDFEVLVCRAYQRVVGALGLA